MKASALMHEGVRYQLRHSDVNRLGDRTPSRRAVARYSGPSAGAGPGGNRGVNNWLVLWGF